MNVCEVFPLICPDSVIVPESWIYSIAVKPSSSMVPVADPLNMSPVWVEILIAKTA
jgi:hypothetical protein